MQFPVLVLLTMCLSTSVSAQPQLLLSALVADTPAELEAQIRDALTREDGQLGVQKGKSVSKVYTALFKMVGPSGILALQTARNDSIAIQAAWQDVALSGANEKDAEQDRSLDRQKLNWFLGFLQGRARCKLPPWWADLLLDARVNRQGRVSIGRPKHDLYHDTGLDHVRSPLDTAVKRDGDKLILRVGDESVEIPAEILAAPNKSGIWCEVSALITPRTSYIAVHDHIGYPFLLTCLDRASGAVRWKTTVWGTIWDDSGGDPPKAFVSVIEQDDRVLVFGAGRFGAHVEAFQTKDGVNLFRFATSYGW